MKYMEESYKVVFPVEYFDLVMDEISETHREYDIGFEE